MIFEIFLNDFAVSSNPLSQWLPPHNLGLYLFVGCVSPLSIIYFFRNHKWSPLFCAGYTGVVSVLCGFSSILGSLDLHDEVFINLTHSYNLYHHGLFSFSSSTKVSGTVEILYYFLLTPFAFSKQVLTQSVFVLNGGLFFVSIWLVNRYIFPRTEIHRNAFWANLFFCMGHPLILIYSCGFGNALIATVLLLGLALYIHGKRVASEVVLGLLPIFRPDGAVYSLCFGAAVLTMRRVIPWRLLFMLVLSEIGYFLISYSVFGEFIPTPIFFKGDKLGMFLNPNMYEVLAANLWQCVSGVKMHWPFYAAVFVLAFKVIWRKTMSPIPSIMGHLILPTGILTVFIIFFDPMSWSSWRYNLLFFMLAAIIPGYFMTALPAVSGEVKKQAVRMLSLAGLTLLFVINVRWFSWRENDRQLYRTDLLARQSFVIEKIIPKSWSLASTEINTLGFLLGRDVTDLFGYTHKAIAKSRLVNTSMSKVYDVMKSDKPDVAWIWWMGWQRKGFVDSKDYERLLTVVNASRGAHSFGDVPKLMNQYDLLDIVSSSGVRVGLIVAKEKTSEILELMRRAGFQLHKSRAINSARLSRLFNADPHFPRTSEKQFFVKNISQGKP